VKSDAGLCDRCKHCHAITNSRGSTFYLCRRAESDPAFARYPQLPVRECRGFELQAVDSGKGESE
jgi:hypothetical protein